MADDWLREFDDASRLVDEIQWNIEERNRLVRTKEDVSRLVAATRRRLTMLGTKVDRLEALLTREQPSSKAIEKERKRREDLIVGLRYKAKEMASVLSSGQAQASRNALLGQEAAGPCPAVETEATVGLSNKGLLSFQQQMMADQDDELLELESTVASTKHIALTINGELDLQRHLLDDLDADVTSTNARIQVAKKKLAIFAQNADKTCNTLLVMLLAVGLVFLALLVYSVLKFL